MRRLLWIGDAACASGFARCTHHTLDTLRHSWEIEVLGLNYRGRPHDFPYSIYPATESDHSDLFGFSQVGTRVREFRPDVVVIQNDPWNFPPYMRLLPNVPVIGVVAVDGLNCRGRELNGLTCAIFWTNFGADQATKGGYRGPYAVVPLGVDLEVYRPENKLAAREKFFRPDDFDRLKNSFIVTNVNRNQPRKRLDLSISYFAEWVKEFGIEDAYLHLHVAPTGDVGYDCQQLMAYYGLSHKLILSMPEVWKGLSEQTLNWNYNISDVGFSTTQGEGWGLTTMEMMACGIPQIVPDWAALGEWTEDAVLKVPCSEVACTINNINVIGGVMDRNESPETREIVGAAGKALVSRPEFRWSAIGEQFNEAIEASLDFLGVKTV
jgi:D-inositol-3-phosphate glycosyltransferase